MKQELAQLLIAQTREIYNQISHDFSDSRSLMWQDLLPLLDYTKKGDRVLDLGCGNGRLFGALQGKSIDYIGVDNSQGLLIIAGQKYPSVNFQLSDGFNLPFRDNFFDIIYCIAVLHHIPSNNFRLRFLAEAKRVLQPNGLFVSTVWKLGQRRSSKLLFKFSFLKIIGRNKMDFGDVLVSWQNKTRRYVHNFSTRGLRKLLRAAGFAEEKSGTLWRPEKKNANLFIVARKLP